MTSWGDARAGRGPLDEFTEGERGLALVGQRGAAWVYEWARPLPLARLVYAAEVIPDSAAARGPGS